MIFYFIFFIYRYSESLIIVTINWTCSIDLLLTLPSKICVNYVCLIVVISECPWLRKIGWTLRLLYQSLVHLLKIILILLHNTRNLLPAHPLCFFKRRIQSMYSHSLLWFGRPWPELLLICLALLKLWGILICLYGIKLCSCCSSSHGLLHLSIIRSHSACSTPDFTCLFIVSIY